MLTPPSGRTFGEPVAEGRPNQLGNSGPGENDHLLPGRGVLLSVPEQVIRYGGILGASNEDVALMADCSVEEVERVIEGFGDKWGHIKQMMRLHIMNQFLEAAMAPGDNMKLGVTIAKGILDFLGSEGDEGTDFFSLDAATGHIGAGDEDRGGAW